MQTLNFVTGLRDIVNDNLLEVHTALPAKIISVDYGAKTVTVAPLVKNRTGTGKVSDYPILRDVPIVLMGGGQSRMSFPFQIGDVGVVQFSERDTSSFHQSTGEDASDPFLTKPLGLYPLAFIPKIGTATDTGDPIDNEKIVLTNVDSRVELSPDGTVLISNPSGSATLDSSGNWVIKDGSGGEISLSNGNLTVKGQTINLNGLIINENGQLTDGQGLSLNQHTHGGVQSGSSETLPPTV